MQSSASVLHVDALPERIAHPANPRLPSSLEARILSFDDKPTALKPWRHGRSETQTADPTNCEVSMAGFRLVLAALRFVRRCWRIVSQYV